jgi:CxxC-x17-CxxC domain-containing protein
MAYDDRGGYRDRPPRKMYTITCADCGKEDQVPFKPAEGRPVYCRECYQKHRQDRGSKDRY